jgi:hypothetical protein
MFRESIAPPQRTIPKIAEEFMAESGAKIAQFRSGELLYRAPVMRCVVQNLDLRTAGLMKHEHVEARKILRDSVAIAWHFYAQEVRDQ